MRSCLFCFVFFLFCLFKLFRSALSLLTARIVGQFAVFPSYIAVSSKAPRPLFSIRITAIIWGCCHAGVWEGRRTSVDVIMRRLWVPSLACEASGSHRDCAGKTSNINVITSAFVWITQYEHTLHFWRARGVLRRQKYLEFQTSDLLHVFSFLHCEVDSSYTFYV